MDKVEIIKKLKALSDRGINGEKENATKLLHKLMKKYGISDEELKNEEMQTIELTLRNNAEIKICSQILYAYFNNANLYKMHGKRTKYWTELTRAQEIEFRYILSTYLNKYYEEQDIFISAFIQKNKIFPMNAKVTYIDDLSAEERAKAVRASLMQQGMEFTRIRKALND